MQRFRFRGRHTFDVSKQDGDVTFFEWLTFSPHGRIWERSYVEPFDRFPVHRRLTGAARGSPFLP